MMYEVTITTENVQETYEVWASSAASAESRAIRRFEIEYADKDSFHEFKVEVR